MTTRKNAEGAQVRINLILSVLVLLAVCAGVLWHQRSRPAAADGELQNRGVPILALPDSTRAALNSLTSTIEFRFYSLLDPATVPDSTRAFAKRVDRMLSEYQQASGGMVKVTRVDTMSEANADAALSDGIRPFNLNEGDACFLGIAVARAGELESIPHLSADWERALEFDLSRAVERVARATPQQRQAATVSQPSLAVTKELRQSLSNLDTISVVDGTRVLREKALDDFKTAVKEMELELKAAEERLTQAQQVQSPAQEKVALQQLQEIQAAQRKKLSQIAARFHTQVSAFEQLKRAAPQPTTGSGP